MSENPSPPSAASARPAHLGWRLFALVYDFFPVLALWFATSALVLVVRGGEPVEPGSLVAWLELALLWAVTGFYAVFSWHRGGQTLGMRPWRLKVLQADGRRPPLRALLIRYAVATVSLAAAGLGLLWCLVDRNRRGWHDLASGTVLVRLDAPPRR
ncbi:RDD family protein [Arenimonas soli]|uniref:RDD family protein n=1 Tax=Arenimonas soli TaxID=2269504 RepID=A0ABQ1HP52_9GAMM|nr:RDD family protein [Arenimonas soli]GGA84539.1 RDD family protein [Arenimonas soli]